MPKGNDHRADSTRWAHRIDMLNWGDPKNIPKKDAEALDALTKDILHKVWVAEEPGMFAGALLPYYIATVVQNVPTEYTADFCAACELMIMMHMKKYARPDIVRAIRNTAERVVRSCDAQIDNASIRN